MNINIRTIPHKSQRYETIGDWIFDKGKLSKIFVSKFKNEDMEFLVAIHEFIEAYLLSKRGVSQEEVDEFDMWYEEARDLGVAACGCKIRPGDEPGFDVHAPYRNEHAFATSIEKKLAKKLNVDWEKYEQEINNL